MMTMMMMIEFHRITGDRDFRTFLFTRLSAAPCNEKQRYAFKALLHVERRCAV